MTAEEVEPGEFFLRASLRKGLQNGLFSALLLVKIVFPLYILINILKDSGLLAKVAVIFFPFMVYFGLPGEAALALLAGNFGNIYAALAVMGPLDLTARQITMMGLMLGLSHSLIIESAILHRMGARPVVFSLFRFLISVCAGLALNQVMPR